ncbi:MAG TPA: hypothetical protein VNT32_12845 [Thermoleophilaceae bacterium]|nr:hypothetical protein [Thermoleophilaceae bacterium]
MSGYVHKRIDDLPTLWDGFAKLVRAGLDITAFGAQIMDLPPDYSTKSHDETETGQEEMYLALSGSGAVVIHGDSGDERLTLDPGHVVKVAPETSRTLSSDGEGMRVLCIGGVPGAPYEVQGWTEPEG